MSVMNSSKTLSCFSDSIGFSSIYTACLGYVKIMVLSIFLSESNSRLSSFISKQVRYDQLFIMISWAVRWLTGVGLEWGRPRLWGAGLETCNEMEKCETEERSGKIHIATLCSRKRSKVKLPPFCWTVGQQIFFFFFVFFLMVFFMCFDCSQSTPSYKTVSIPSWEERSIPMLEDLPTLGVLSGQSLWYLKAEVWANAGYSGIWVPWTWRADALLIQSYILLLQINKSQTCCILQKWLTQFGGRLDCAF